MSLSFASAPGNLFNCIGKLGDLLSEMRSYQDAQLINLTDATVGAVAQYTDESDVQAIIGGGYIGVLNAAGSVGGLAAQVAQATVNRKVFRDNPRPGQTLTNINILDSIIEVIRQMKAQGATVRACTITATPSGITGDGNSGVILVSTKRALDGLVLENTYSETLHLTCTNDSYIGGATAGNEGFSLTGQGDEVDPYAFDWPLGSNAQTQISAVDGNEDNSSGNLLTNSGFESFTNDAPDSWEIVTGVPGANYFDENTLVFDPELGGSALRLTANGTAIEFKQAFSSGDGTAGELLPLTQYGFNIFARRDGIAPAAGVITIDLVDEDDVVLLDANGVSNTMSIDCTSELSTNYAAFNVAFRTPLILPDQTYLRIRLPNLTSGRSVYLDKGAMALMTQAHTSGPSIALFTGRNNFSTGDNGTVTVVNSRGSGGTLDTFQTVWARLLPQMIQNELLLPSSATPSIDDALIG